VPGGKFLPAEDERETGERATTAGSGRVEPLTSPSSADADAKDDDDGGGADGGGGVWALSYGNIAALTVGIALVVVLVVCSVVAALRCKKRGPCAIILHVAV